MIRKLQSKVAIISGGASGIGAATAKLFVHHGAKVILADVCDEAGVHVCQELGSEAALYVHCDVSKEEDVASCVDLAISRYNRLDIMFNNAGVAETTMSGTRASISEVTAEQYHRIMDVNANGVFFGVKHAARVMIPRKQGCILNTGSLASASAPGRNHAYTISKHTVVGITKSAASELCRHGIRVNCILPFMVATKLSFDCLKLARPELEMEDVEGLVSENSYLPGMTLTSDHIAKAALFLGSEDGEFISGHNLVVDGSFSVSKVYNLFQNPYDTTRPA